MNPLRLTPLRLRSVITPAMIALSFQVFAEQAPVSQLNYQDDYICNATTGNVITSGILDVADLQSQRFGFTYPVQITTVWLKGDGQTGWHQLKFNSTLNFDAYKGIRVAIKPQNTNCKTGEITTSVKDNVKKEAVITANVCTPQALETAQVQILFEAVN